MISALRALMTYFLADAPLVVLVETRIAARHRYRDGWARGASALTVKYNGGLNKRYTPEFYGGVQLDCYGKTIADAEKIYHALVTLQRAFQAAGREVVTVGDDSALITLFDLVSAPTPLHDADVDMPYLMVFGEILVAEAVIT